MSKLSKTLKKIINRTEPRPLVEIQKEYNELCAKAANCSYQSYIYEQTLDEVHNRMQEVNAEANERNKLDAAAAPQATSPNQVKGKE